MNGGVREEGFIQGMVGMRGTKKDYPRVDSGCGGKE